MGEVCFAPISEFDFDNKIWTIPSSRTKNGRDQVVPLTDYTIKLIKDAYALCGSKGKYLFPVHNNPNNTKAPSNHNALSHNIREVQQYLSFDEFKAKDFRRTVKTLLINMQFNKEDVDKLQNHYKKDISTKHYDRSDYLHIKRPIMETWNNELQQQEK